MPLPLHIVIVGSPTTKKTSSRLREFGPRCPKCRRGTRSIPLPSENFEAWEKVAAPQLRAAWAAAAPPGPEVRCTKCDGSGVHNGVCLGCAGTGSRPPPEERFVQVAAVFYREANRGDLYGYLQALGDALETAGVIVNDRQIVNPDGSRLAKDAAHPRVELTITEAAAPVEDVPQLSLLSR